MKKYDEENITKDIVIDDDDEVLTSSLTPGGCICSQSFACILAGGLCGYIGILLNCSIISMVLLMV